MEGWQIAGLLLTLMLLLLVAVVIIIYLAVEQIERDLDGLEEYLGVTRTDIQRHTKYNKKEK